MNVIVIGGFLGSGKTTVLLQIARHLNQNTPRSNSVVIIENEIGEVSIDDRLIANQGYVVQAMFAGCACCTIKGKLEIGISTIQKDLDPEWIVIEASGVASPGDIGLNLREDLGLDCTVVALIDASRLLTLMSVARHLLESQISGTDLLLVNKINTTTPEQLEEVHTSLLTLGPEVDILDIDAKSQIASEDLDRIIRKR